MNDGEKLRLVVPSAIDTTKEPAKYARRPTPAFNLRMPEDLKLRLKVAAKENRRSLNEEIVYRLFRSLDGYRH